MSETILRIMSCSKVYREYTSEWYRVLSWLGINTAHAKANSVLKPTSFSVAKGECVAIVGQNGAGKSTLLKMITGTLKPTTGEIIKQGRIAAILELGMGFHPDLTGRQNAYHSAGLMGFTKEQIDAVIEHIERFAEIGIYFDQPVRTYSSGMQVRVAFAVATAYRPEILIIDEALSVGDAYFQHKSFDRIRHFQEHGTTLLFVSHDRNAIQAICDRVLLFEKGELLKDGAPEEVMDYYNAMIAEKEETTVQQTSLENGKIQTISGTGEAKIEAIHLYNTAGEKTEMVDVGESLVLRIRAKVYQDIPSLVLGYSIKDRLGQTLYGTNTWHTQQVIQTPKAGECYEWSIAFEASFGVGSYSIQIALVDQDTHLSANYEWKDLALLFEVINKSKAYFVGLLWQEPSIRIEKV